MSEQPARPAAPAGKPGRYQRSALSLVTSLVVTVVVVGGGILFLGVFRNDYQRTPDQVDYLETVQTLQQAGQSPAYPPSLPQGWTATGVDVPTPDDPGTMLRLLTDKGKFVGVRQEQASPLSLVRQWVDEDATNAPDHRSGSALAGDWKGWADSGGDSAYTAEVGDTTVIVFGSAPRAQLQRIVDSLTAAPVG